MDAFILEVKSFFRQEQWEKFDYKKQFNFGALCYIYKACQYLHINVVIPDFMAREINTVYVEDERSVMEETKHAKKKKILSKKAIKKKEKESIFPCPYCNITYALKKDRNTHKKTCRKRFDFPNKSTKYKHKCPHCNYGTNIITSIETHMRTHTQERPYTCNDCMNSFSQKTDLQNHILAIHSKQEKKYKCKECEYKTHRVNSYNRHMRTHSNKKSYICEYCKQGFNFKDSYENHLAYTHEGKEKPFKCEICERKFLKNAHLVEHIKTVHIRTKEHKCTECNYQCANVYYLKRHIMTHTNQKPYKCAYCSYSCTTSSDLKKHVNNKHVDYKDKPIKCDFCEYRTCLNADLKKHLKKKHSEPQEEPNEDVVILEN